MEQPGMAEPIREITNGVRVGGLWAGCRTSRRLGAEVGDFRTASGGKTQLFAESVASSAEPRQTFQTGTQEVGGRIGKKNQD